MQNWNSFDYKIFCVLYITVHDFSLLFHTIFNWIVVYLSQSESDSTSLKKKRLSEKVSTCICHPFNLRTFERKKLISRYLAHTPIHIDGNGSIFGAPYFQLTANSAFIFTIFIQAMFCLKSKSHQSKIQKKSEEKKSFFSSSPLLRWKESRVWLIK